MKNNKNFSNAILVLLFFFASVICLSTAGLCDEKEDLYGRENKSVTVNFDQSSQLPEGFRIETTGFTSHNAIWQVVKDEQAPSKPNVLKITKIPSPSGSQFNVCWSDRIRFRDGDIEVKVRADNGHIDQGGGPMWRVKDRMNYYVARLNPLEANFRIYYVKEGDRVMIGTSRVNGIKRGQWFTIKITVKDNLISGWVNGDKLIEVKDSTLGDEGGIGLWSKADAASSFDDLSVHMKE